MPGARKPQPLRRLTFVKKNVSCGAVHYAPWNLACNASCASSGRCGGAGLCGLVTSGSRPSRPSRYVSQRVRLRCCAASTRLGQATIVPHLTPPGFEDGSNRFVCQRAFTSAGSAVHPFVRGGWFVRQAATGGARVGCQSKHGRGVLEVFAPLCIEAGMPVKAGAELRMQSWIC